MEASITVLAPGSNDILFMEKVAFLLKGNLLSLKNRIHDLPLVKGSRKNPYGDLYEASSYLVGRMACMATHTINNPSEISIVVAKTDRTPPEVALAFSQAASAHGLNQVIIPDKWFAVTMRTRDHFELGIYKKNFREPFETANIVLAVDSRPVDEKISQIAAQLLALESIDTKIGGEHSFLGAGMALPHCSSGGYARFRPMPFSTGQQKAPKSSFKKDVTASKRKPVPRSFVPKSLKKRNTQSKQVKAAMAESQRVMLADMTRNLKDRLTRESISPIIINMIEFKGKLELPDCRTEKHYLSIQNIPPRHYCNVNYHIAVWIKNKKLFNFKGRSLGSGSSNDAAWEQSLLGITESIYPIISEIALTISERKTLEELRRALNRLDKSIWNFSQESDIDHIVRFIQKQIDELDL
jgi:hypothetical protein